MLYTHISQDKAGDFESILTELKKLVNNYPLHIIDINKFENTDAFETDLKQIFNFIRNSRNGMKLHMMLLQHLLMLQS